MKAKAIRYGIYIALVLIVLYSFSSCTAQRHCRPEFMVGYGKGR